MHKIKSGNRTKAIQIFSEDLQIEHSGGRGSKTRSKISYLSVKPPSKYEQSLPYSFFHLCYFLQDQNWITEGHHPAMKWKLINEPVQSKAYEHAEKSYEAATSSLTYIFLQ